MSELLVLPPEVAELLALAAPDVVAVPPLLVPLPVPVPLPPPPLPPCSLTPLSLPQFAVYHCSTAVLSVALLQEVAHMVVRSWLLPVQTLLQKHCHRLPQDEAAEVRTEQEEAQEGRLPMPWWRSCAEARAGRRIVRAVKVFILNVSPDSSARCACKSASL